MFVWSCLLLKDMITWVLKWPTLFRYSYLLLHFPHLDHSLGILVSHSPLFSFIGWLDRTPSWHWEVWFFQGLQNFHLCLLVDTPGNQHAILKNPRIFSLPLLQASCFFFSSCFQGVSRALVENSRTLRLPSHLHERLSLIRNAKIRLEEKGITPSIDVSIVTKMMMLLFFFTFLDYFSSFYSLFPFLLSENRRMLEHVPEES